jgi:uncharacterized protein (DUF433 family)
MKTTQKSLRIPDPIARSIEDLARLSDRDFSSTAVELISEALMMRRCPGILFADGPAGRRARLAGTGMDVWELIAVYRSLEQDFDQLRQAYHWLSEPQIRAALAFYAAYPEEIDRRIALNERWTPDCLRREHPALAARLK